ncbi:MAG: T9SS type A sorting domain-containing protein [Candidatus Latescibacterota bacterium]|nr:MAG: T9SS type A sorting domain-containing protein [Candidatus Latescibacterota bacterium]
MIDKRQHVSLTIYDTSGRLVRTLVDREMESGVYGEEWDGRDAKGHTVASGVYFCRLGAGNRTLTRKAVFLK